MVRISMRVFALVAALVGSGALGGGGGTALAQDARELFSQGQEAYAHGRYEDAIDSWDRAYALDPRPPLQYNLAQAYGRLGRVEDEQRALTAYVEGSRAAGIPEDDEQLTSARARLVAIGDRIRRTGIQLSGVPDGARVAIDGDRVEFAEGRSVPLAPGPHRVVVSLEGHEDFNTSVVVRAGETMVVPVMLDRERVVVGTAPVPAPRRSPVRPIGIAGMAVGGAVVVVGVGLGVGALRRSDGALEGSSDASTAKSLALGADINFAIGTALAVTGLVMTIVGGRDHDDDAPVQAFVPVVSPTYGGATFLRRF